MEKTRAVVIVDFFQRVQRQAAMARLAFVQSHKHDFQALEKERENIVSSAEWTITQLSNETPLILDFVQALGPYLRSQGHWHEHIRWLEACEKICLQRNDMAELAIVYNNLGELNHELGKSDEALQYYFKSREINVELGNAEGMAAVAPKPRGSLRISW